MEMRRLGASGLEVSSLCLGTMVFGGPTDAATAARIIAAARDAGVNFIDTADQYCMGVSEEIVGRAIKANRDDWVLATKAGNPMGPGPNQSGLGRKWLIRALDASLARLECDYVDIYYLHLDDHETPIEETLFAVKEILSAGKARYYGLSNYRGWRIAEVVRIAGQLAMPRPVVCQPYYNAMDRTPEVEILPACGHYGLGVVPYSPLARGVLTAKYAPGAEPPPDSRVARDDERILQTEYRAESLEIAQKFKRHAEARGMSSAHFALNWVLANPFVSAVLAGPRTEEQWQDYVSALEHRLTPEDEDFVDSLVAPGHPSTHGYSDPRYPLRGRPRR